MQSLFRKWSREIQVAKEDTIVYSHLRSETYILGIRVRRENLKSVMDLNGKGDSPGFKQTKKLHE